MPAVTIMSTQLNIVIRINADGTVAMSYNYVTPPSDFAHEHADYVETFWSADAALRFCAAYVRPTDRITFTAE